MSKVVSSYEDYKILGFDFPESLLKSQPELCSIVRQYITETNKTVTMGFHDFGYKDSSICLPYTMIEDVNLLMHHHIVFTTMNNKNYENRIMEENCFSVTVNYDGILTKFILGYIETKLGLKDFVLKFVVTNRIRFVIGDKYE